MNAATNRAVTVIAGTIVHRISSGLLPCVCSGSVVVTGLAPEAQRDEDQQAFDEHEHDAPR